ncbi:ABC transporter [Microbacterium sp. A196]|uniref:ABC transporter n=1 Tax=unclassified Microbacterium TaxID=2609290 RepID=UPI003FD2F7AB
MSDPEVPQNEHKSDVDDVVDSANAGLADAEAARGDSPAQPAEADASASVNDPVDYNAVDPDLAAFEAAERDHPGTFGASEPDAASSGDDYRSAATSSDATEFGAASESAASDVVVTDVVASGEYDAPTRVVPSEPVAETVVVAPISQHQPIFVQAPEPPRDRGNRGTAAGIGLIATLSFAILYLGTALGLQALVGDVTGENIGEAALAPLTTWGFWVPVVVFFIGFWLLGAIINRGRWGLWVVFGLIVGLFAWAGHILGQLFEAPFWLLSAREGSELALSEGLAPLAIAAFVFGRELTIWFGAWVARSGARKTELNAEAQREYERTIEAGPTLSR